MQFVQSLAVHSYKEYSIPMVDLNQLAVVHHDPTLRVRIEEERKPEPLIVQTKVKKQIEEEVEEEENLEK